MRFKNKFSLFFLILAIVTLVFPIFSSVADNALTISVDDNNTATRGNKFEVPIIISDNPGLTTLSVKLSFDSSVMRFDTVNFPDFLLYDESIECTVDRKGFTIKASGSPMTRNGVYATAVFVLDKKAELGSYKIKPTVGSSSIIDADMLAVNATMKSGYVRLSCLHNYTKTVTKPTCSSEGYTEYRCTECSITYISDYVAKTEHNWKTVSSEEPTCTEAGSLVRECKACGEREVKQSGEPLGHSYDNGIITSPTCTTEGYTTYTCGRCGKTFKDSYTAVSNHRYHKTYTENATCAKTGFDLYSCEYCGTSYQITIPTLEHMWQVVNYAATHDEGGWSLYTCSSCTLSMRGNFTDKLDYTLIWSVTTQPTCESVGIKRGVCSDGCGYSLTEEIPALGHSYGEWTSIKKATVVSRGVWQSSCQRCGYTIEATTDQLESIKAYEPDYFSLDFWKAVAMRIVESAAFSSAAFVLIAAIFFIILFAMISKAKRKRRDRSVEDMRRFADEIDEALKKQRKPPRVLPDSFCHDIEDFCLPNEPFDVSNDENDG